MITAALLLFAAAATTAADKECGDLPQQPMNLCYLKHYERADAAMNAQWKIVVAAMKQADGEIDRTNDKQPGYYETLLAGQRAWLTWREKQCLLESFDMRGGSGQAMVHAMCMLRLTEERTQQLRELVESEN
jgi:uncharacterized protein YecT (DUF1311 family)